MSIKPYVIQIQPTFPTPISTTLVFMLFLQRIKYAPDSEQYFLFPQPATHFTHNILFYFYVIVFLIEV